MGIRLVDFWEMTPLEFTYHADAHNENRREHARDMAIMALHMRKATLTSGKKRLSLSDFYEDDSPGRKEIDSARALERLEEHEKWFNEMDAKLSEGKLRIKKAMQWA